MTLLKLITTEKFGSIPCDFYRNMNDDILLTREQIGSALEYANPMMLYQKYTEDIKIVWINFQ